MKKRFVAPVLRSEATLGVLTLGFQAVISVAGCLNCDFDNNLDGNVVP